MMFMGPVGDYLEGLFIYHYVILSIFVIRNQITLTTVFGSKVKKLELKKSREPPTTLEEERHYVARVRAEEWVWERMRIFK